jgi:hypothetical protein
MRNVITLAQFDKMADKSIQSLSVSDLEVLLDELAAINKLSKKRSARLSAEMSRRFADEAKRLRASKGTDTGSVRIASDGKTIVADLPKKVTWDQAKMAKAVAVIQSWGTPGNPINLAEYVDTEYTIPERRFTNWPSDITRIFADARTVSTGTQTFKFEAEKENA